MSDDKPVTNRGFRTYAEWKDSRGQTIRVQESSSAEGPHVWIFVNDDDGRSVNHWKNGGGWEPQPAPEALRSPGEGDPIWEPGQPLVTMSEGWSSMSPHLSIEDCHKLIAALQMHIEEQDRD